MSNVDIYIDSLKRRSQSGDDCVAFERKVRTRYSVTHQDCSSTQVDCRHDAIDLFNKMYPPVTCSFNGIPFDQLVRKVRDMRELFDGGNDNVDEELMLGGKSFGRLLQR